MGTVSRVHTFSSGAILTAAQLNNEFDNLLTSSAINGGLDATNLGVTAGQATASKALVVDSSRNLADGTAGNRINNLALSGTFESTGLITATAGITSGSNIVSDTDSTDDLGTTSVRWRNLYVDDVTVTNNVSIGGALTLTGGISLNGDTTIGNSASDTLTVTATVTSNLIFADNTYDIGASGATRPRDLHLSRNALMGGTLGVTGLLTATAGVTSGSNIVSDTDSTDDLGTTSVRWANLYVDSIGDTGQALAITAGSNNVNVTAGTLALTGAQTISGDLAVATSALFVDASTGGDIGIGTTSIASGGTDTRNVTIHNSNSQSTYLKLSNNATGTTNSDGFDMISGADGQAYVYNRENAILNFATNSTIAAKILANGDFTVDDKLYVDVSDSRVGINNASPTHSLSVKDTSGSILRLQGISDFNYDIESQGDGTLFDHEIGSANAKFSWSSSSAELMRLDSTGLGIGTASPQLSVSTEVPLGGLDGFGVQHSNDTGEVRMGATNSNGTYFTALYSNGSEAARITSDGDLLIGETSDQIARVYVSTSTSGDYAYIGQTTHADRGPAVFLNTNGSFNDIMLVLQATRAATTGYDFARFNSGAGADIEFLFDGDGTAYADGSWQGSGADYQEYFESNTGNAAEVGRAIVLDGDRVRYYNADTDSTDDIVGVTRPQADNKNSAVVGNVAWNHWTDKYLTDDWGVYLREDVTVWTYANEKGEEFAVYERDELAKDPNWTPPENATSSTESVRKLNPDYDESLKEGYQSRKDRDEWWLIGLLGQIQVKAGEAVNPRWIKMKNISDAVELYYVR